MSRSHERDYSGFPVERKKPTKKEIKRGGGKFGIRKNRNTEKWRRELERWRRKKQDPLLTLVLNSVIMHIEE